MDKVDVFALAKGGVVVYEAQFCEGSERGADEVIIVGVGSALLHKEGADIAGASLVNAPHSCVGI